MIFVLYNVWQEGDRLARSMESVAQACRHEDVRFVTVDGRYPSFPGEGRYSCDATEMVARAFGTYLPYSDEECEKRTHGLRFIDGEARPGDWVLVMDADEVLYLLRPPTTPVPGIIRFTRRSDAKSYDRARLYPWTPGMEFREKHYRLFAGERLVADLTEAPNAVCVGAGIHEDSCNAERAVAKYTYYRWLTNHEQGMA